MLQQRGVLRTRRDELLQEEDQARQERALVLQEEQWRRMLLQRRVMHDAEQAG